MFIGPDCRLQSQNSFQLLSFILSSYRSTSIYPNILLISSFAETQNTSCHGILPPAMIVLGSFRVI